MTILIQVAVNGIMVGGLYALIALGVVLIYKSCSIFNFAQGALLMIGAYFCWQLLVRFGLPLWLSFIGTIGFATIMGLIIERFCLRPLIGQPILSAVMLTLALGYAIDGIVLLVWGGTEQLFPVFPRTPIVLGNISLSQEYLWSFVIALILFGVIAAFFRFTMSGLQMRAVAEDHQVARSLGVKVTQVFAQTWVMAAIVAAIGGILLGSLQGISTTMSMDGLTAFPVVLLGGLESTLGAIVAGPLIGLIENLGALYLDPIVGGGIKQVAPFVVMLVVLIVKPFGLFGQKRIERI